MTEKLQTAKMQAVILREPSVVSSELAVGLTEKGKLESMPGKA